MDNNGAIYPNIEFPIGYLKWRIIDCKTTKLIAQNSSIFYIPYKIIIDSSKIEVNTTLPSLSRHNSTKLAYFLMKEFDKRDKSFFKPYLDLIISNDYLSYPVFWNEEDNIELNDSEFDDKILNLNDEINQTFELIKKKLILMYLIQLFLKKFIYLLFRTK